MRGRLHDSKKIFSELGAYMTNEWSMHSEKLVSTHLVIVKVSV
jgi:hypothetical protein